MSNDYKKAEIANDAIVIGVVLTPLADKDAMKVQVIPSQGVDTLWQAFGYLMEAVGTTAASFAKNANPKQITEYEDMAGYVSEYITKVIMHATPKDKL